MHHPFWISQWIWETDCLHDDDKLVFCLFTECTGTLAGCCKTAWSKHCQQTQQARWRWPNTKQMFLELWWVWHTSPESDVLEIGVCISSLTGLLKNMYTYTYIHTYILTYLHKVLVHVLKLWQGNKENHNIFLHMILYPCLYRLFK